MEDNPRPFGQVAYPAEEVRLEILRGYAMRFSLLIPLLWKGKVVFSPEDLLDLDALLTRDLGGCTRTHDVAHPLFQGTYEDQAGNVVRNENALYVVYTRHTDRSVEYFRELQDHLQKHSGEEKILIEMIPVQLL
jgi:hypothetical protein